MADSGVLTITGEGEYLFAAAQTVTDVMFWIDTPSISITYRSTTYPRRLLHAGWVALASGQLGVPSSGLSPPDPTITWHDYLAFENNLKHAPSGFNFDDRALWAIPPGITCKLQIFW